MVRNQKNCAPKLKLLSKDEEAEKAEGMKSNTSMHLQLFQKKIRTKIIVIHLVFVLSFLAR